MIRMITDIDENDCITAIAAAIYFDFSRPLFFCTSNRYKQEGDNCLYLPDVMDHGIRFKHKLILLSL